MSDEKNERKIDRDTIGLASPGPWIVEHASAHRAAVYEKSASGYEKIAEVYCGASRGHGIDNAKFMARARTRWPEVLDRIEELEKENEGLKQKLSTAVRDIRMTAEGDIYNAECERDEALLELSRARSTVAELEERLARSSEENGRLKDWRDNISKLIKGRPEFSIDHWHGDKEGWGYHFEVIAHVFRERDSFKAKSESLADELAKSSTEIESLKEALARVERERDEAEEELAIWTKACHNEARENARLNLRADDLEQSLENARIKLEELRRELDDVKSLFSGRETR